MLTFNGPLKVNVTFYNHILFTIFTEIYGKKSNFSANIT